MSCTQEPASAGASPRSIGRRSFLAGLLGVGSASVGALLSVPLVRFVLYPLLRTTTEIKWSDVGSAGDFSGAAPIKKIITVEQRDGWRKLSSEKAVYVVPGNDGKLRVFSPICPHLGCSVGWNAGQNQFVCPCHGGVFASAGERISGPPPRGLDELESRVEDGTLQVRYQYFRQLVKTKEALS